MEIVEKYGLLVLAWIGFGLIHSLLASAKLKERLGLSPLNYRRLYNLQSLILFFAILIYGATIIPTYFLENGKANKAIGLMCATFGYLLFKMVFKQISLGAFLGLKAEKEAKLITSGIYARVRHPLYTATILLGIGFLIFSPSYTNVVHLVSIVLYIFIGASFEEKRLEKIYGETYRKYKNATPFLIPTVKTP